VMWDCGTRIDLADLACLSLGEYLVHGYDVAATVGRPGPATPDTPRSCCAATCPCAP
jgi:hypothetical protein